MSISMQPNGSGSSITMKRSLFTVFCVNSTVDPSQTQMSGDAFNTATAGQIMSLTMTLKDAQGNIRTSWSDTLVVTLKGSTLVSVWSTWVIDNDN